MAEQIIPSNFNVNDHIVVTAGNDASCLLGTGEGKLRFICGDSHLNYDDPIVNPKMPGAAHLHHHFGNSLTWAGSTYRSLRTTGDGTCAGGPINRTGYWYPAMIRPAGPGFPVAKVVKPAWLELYYAIGPDELVDFERQPGSVEGVAPITYAVQGFPPGFRLVWGWKHSDEGNAFGVWGRENTADATGSPSPNANTGFYNTLADLADAYPSNAVSTEGHYDNIFARINGPGCWDGVNLTGTAGRSHVSYGMQDGNGNFVCPETHPYRIPSILVIVSFSHNGTDDFRNWHISSDTHAGESQPGGTTFHTDWYGGWDMGVERGWEFDILGIGRTTDPALQKTSVGGILCTGDRALDSSNLLPGRVNNGWGSWHLPEADRYLDIPTFYPRKFTAATFTAP